MALVPFPLKTALVELRTVTSRIFPSPIFSCPSGGNTISSTTSTTTPLVLTFRQSSRYESTVTCRAVGARDRDGTGVGEKVRVGAKVVVGASLGASVGAKATSESKTIHS